MMCPRSGRGGHTATAPGIGMADPGTQQLSFRQGFFDSINEELNTVEPAPVRPSDWLPVMLETAGRLYKNG